MRNEMRRKPMHYGICVQGHLDRTFQHRFEGLCLEQQEAGTTLLSGDLPDQAVLQGLLLQIVRLGLVLLSLETSEAPGQEAAERERRMTSIWYEILPVTLEAEQVVALYRCEDEKAQPWLVPHQAGTHPNDAIRAHLERCFGDLFKPEASIVHSTSWRYCRRTERLILTYLVVMPQCGWSYHRIASERMMARRLGKVEQARGDHLHPPEKIEANNVLAHALDHLAMLRTSDERINEVLEAGWRGVLETRIPKPAGYVEVEETNEAAFFGHQNCMGDAGHGSNKGQALAEPNNRERKKQDD